MKIEAAPLKKRYKIVGAILIVVILCGISFYAGGIIGFMEGYTGYPNTEAPFNAIRDVIILKNIRKGDLKLAIEFLEMDLDEQMISDALGKYCGSSIFDFWGTRKHDKTKMARLRKQIDQYRLEYPTKSSAVVSIEKILNSNEQKNKNK